MNFWNSHTELLALEAEDFVHAAYHLVLGRAPDEAGLCYYVARLRIGYSKFSVLSELGTSHEARGWDALPALSQAIRRYQMGRWPIVGWMFRRFWRVEGETVRERLQRAMVISFATAHKELSRTGTARAEFERRMAAEIGAVKLELESTSAQIADIAEIQSNLYAAAAAAVLPSGGASSDSKLTHRRNLLAERLSPRAREAFNQLVSS